MVSDAPIEQWEVEDSTFAERVIAWFADKYAQVWDAEGTYIGWDMLSET